MGVAGQGLVSELLACVDRLAHWEHNILRRIGFQEQVWRVLDLISRLHCVDSRGVRK